MIVPIFEKYENRKIRIRFWWNADEFFVESIMRIRVVQLYIYIFKRQNEKRHETSKARDHIIIIDLHGNITI